MGLVKKGCNVEEKTAKEGRCVGLVIGTGVFILSGFLKFIV